MLDHIDFGSTMLVTYHDDADASSVRRIGHILSINTTRYEGCPIIVKVVMKLTISRAKLLLCEEQGIVKECQRVEDVEIELQQG